jgi:hypothetical protein
MRAQRLQRHFLGPIVLAFALASTPANITSLLGGIAHAAPARKPAKPARRKPGAAPPPAAEAPVVTPADAHTSEIPPPPMPGAPKPAAAAPAPTTKGLPAPPAPTPAAKGSPTSAAAPAATRASSSPAAAAAPSTGASASREPAPREQGKATVGESGGTSEGGPSLEALRAEYDLLRDAVFRSRARRETMEKALLGTKLATTLRWLSARHHVLQRAELRLDGVRLWESSSGLADDKPLVLSPRSAPPGLHVLGVRVEVRARANPKLGYVSEQSFSIELAEGKTNLVAITLDEDGDAPSYNPDMDVEVSVED